MEEEFYPLKAGYLFKESKIMEKGDFIKIVIHRNLYDEDKAPGFSFLRTVYNRWFCTTEIYRGIKVNHSTEQARQCPCAGIQPVGFYG